MTKLERIQLLYKEALPAKIGIRDDSPMVCRSTTKINSSKQEQNIWYGLNFELNWKHVWTLDYCFGEARTCTFRPCITFHPNDLMYISLCQHMQDAKAGAICRMQFRPIDGVVSPDILRLFWWFLYWIRLKICKIRLYDLTWKIWLFMTLQLSLDFIGCDFCFKIRYIASWNTEKITFMTLNGPSQ